MKKNILSACLLLLIVGFANSQILLIRNDILPPDSTKEFFYGDLSFFFDINNREPLFSDRVSYIGLEFGTQMSYFSEKHAYFLRAGIDYFKITGDPLISTGHLHLRTNINRLNLLSYELYTQAQYDALRQLEVRAVGGANLRLGVITNSQIRALYLGAGPMYEYETWTSFETGELVQVDYLKLNSYFKYRRSITDNILMILVTHYQVGKDRAEDIWRNRVSFEGELEFIINEKLSFVATWAVQYEDKPIIDINKNVYQFLNGLKYQF